MQNTVDQIVNDLVDPSRNLSDILLKMQVLASHLREPDLTSWVVYEQEGYPTGITLPEYRRSAPFNILGNFAGHGGGKLINVGIPLVAFGTRARRYVSDSSISIGARAIESTIAGASDGDGSLTIYLPTEYIATLSPVYEGMTCIGAWRVESVAAYAQVLTTAKRRALDFVLRLQSKFPQIVGAQIDFRELHPAEVHMIYNTSITGGIHGSNVAINNSEVLNSPAQEMRSFTVSGLNLREFVQSLKTTVPTLPLAKEGRCEVESDIITIEAQLGSPKPKSKIISASLESLKHVLESSVAQLAASHINDIGSWIEHLGRAVGPP